MAERGWKSGLVVSDRLHLAYAIVSSRDDWDRYEGLQWYATEEYAVQPQWLDPTGIGGGSRWMDRVVGFGSMSATLTPE